MAHRVCPWWIGYFLLSPLRRLAQDPERILAPYVSDGMTVLDVGCGMGYFSLPLARKVGPQGRVVCLDVQPRMLAALARRADRAGLAGRIEARLCHADGLGVEDLRGQVGFALLFAVAHEVPDATSLFRQVRVALRPGARVLIAEPRGHVPAVEFARSLDLAVAAGLSLVDQPDIARAHSAVLVSTPTGNDSRSQQ